MRTSPMANTSSSTGHTKERKPNLFLRLGLLWTNLFRLNMSSLHSKSIHPGSLVSFTSIHHLAPQAYDGDHATGIGSTLPPKGKREP